MSSSLAVSPCVNPFRVRIPPSRACSRVQLWARCCAEVGDEAKAVSRRGLVIASGLVSADIGRAMAAARRPPPPPPGEKKDPNVSGVQAKVLASKKRKVAMKEAVAKLREKGKTSSD